VKGGISTGGETRLERGGEGNSEPWREKKKKKPNTTGLAVRKISGKWYKCGFGATVPLYRRILHKGNVKGLEGESLGGKSERENRYNLSERGKNLKQKTLRERNLGGRG